MPRVDVVGVVAVDVVREAALFPELEEEPAGHALAEDRVQHVDRELVRVIGLHRPPAHAEVRLLRALPEKLRPRLSRLRCRHDRSRFARREPSERRFDRGDRLVRVERSGERDDRPRRCVPAIHERAQVVGGHRQHDLLASGDLPPEWVARVEQLVDERVHPVLRLVAIHAELLDDHAALRLHVGGTQRGSADHVGDHVERDEIVSRDHARPEHGDLFVGRRVDHTASTFDLLADVGRGRPLRRSLEDHVLEEVARAGFHLRLHARAHAHVDGHRHRPCLGHLRDEYPQAVRKSDAAVVHRGRC